MTRRLVLLTLLALALAARADAPSWNYITSQDGLRVALDEAKQQGLPACVAVGRGFKCAPIRLEVQCLTRDLGRADWFDKHTDTTGCELVLVVVETSRAQADAVTEATREDRQLPE